ncbi:MAG: DsbA family protein [Patescibacteria group bacterium]|nr:DsbA family protein [Patescibacteria group bacterium]
MKRIIFWIIFLLVLVLIIWGLFVAMQKGSRNGVPNLGAPAPVTAADHTEGPADAPVTLIEYGDFECPACGEYAPMVERLFQQSSTTMRLVFRHFPLPQHLNAPIAAQASEAASDQGRFWDMYKLLYAGQDSWANLSVSDAAKVFDGYARSLGLDIAQFDTDINSTTTKAFIQSELSEGQQLGIDYTPTFFVNGKIIQNPQSYDSFKSIIDSAAK